MESNPQTTTPRVAVRWPFRVLTVVIVLTGVVATVSMVLSGWPQGAASVRWQLLASLPGVAWLVRLAWYAAVRAQAPTPEYWPFASQRVLTFYVIVWCAVMYIH